MKKKILLTGCAGFIGTNFVKGICLKPEVAQEFDFHIIDALTYAGKYENIAQDLATHSHLSFQKLDIRDRAGVENLFTQHEFSGVIHFAAESHVDRSIENPQVFVETNVLGTSHLLFSSLQAWNKNPQFRFLQVSTDEVYGSLEKSEPAFSEFTPLAPNSPYSASKASADLLCRSFFETYQLPVVITRCSNNYGPYQHQEKFIPVVIRKALAGQKIPVYGTGENIRDWIFVDDHNHGVWRSFLNGKSGEVYNFGGECELTNLQLAKKIVEILGKSENLIQFVEDRKGHDFRYAINCRKAKTDLNWKQNMSFDEGLKKTIQWYCQ